MLVETILCVLLILSLGSCYENRRTYGIIPNYLSEQNDIIKSLEDANILQKYYLYHFKPVGSLKVEFHPMGSDERFPVTLGNYISPLNSLETPNLSFKSFFSFEKSFSKDLYAIALTDLGPEYEKCHAIWTNIRLDKKSFENEAIDSGANNEDYWKLEDSTGEFSTVNTGRYGKGFNVHFNLRDGTTVVPYIGPRPQKDTGIHKYVFILFRQPHGKIPVEKLNYRERWGSKDPDNGIEFWADYYNLQPLAVNFFRSANEGDF